jgi:NAD(P)H-dependent FMN reductase
MKKILAFAGSNSKTSINKQLVTYASDLIDNAEVNILDLNDFELPIYAIDLEQSQGIPDNAHKFFNLIKESDGLLISLAEHNGTYATVFKNLFDWMSRIESKTFCSKPMLLMATSPGGRGGASVLEAAASRFPFHDAKIVAQFSLPMFGDNFKDGQLVNVDLNEQLKLAVQKLQSAL